MIGVDLRLTIPLVKIRYVVRLNVQYLSPSIIPHHSEISLAVEFYPSLAEQGKKRKIQSFPKINHSLFVASYHKNSDGINNFGRFR